jgi:hypothetical protein
MKSEHIVIDNFLDKKNFDNILDVIPVGLAWGFNQTIADTEETPVNPTDHYWTHLFYGLNPRSEGGVSAYLPFVFSNHDQSAIILAPILEKLDPRFVMRIKANLYPNTPKLVEHNQHRDFAYHHCGALFSVNTCDGYTRLHDGTKVNSVANRMLIFDAGEPHSSTSTTNQMARINININFIGHGE